MTLSPDYNRLKIKFYTQKTQVIHRINKKYKQVVQIP